MNTYLLGMQKHRYLSITGVFLCPSPLIQEDNIQLSGYLFEISSITTAEFQS